MFWDDLDCCILTSPRVLGDLDPTCVMSVVVLLTPRQLCNSPLAPFPIVRPILHGPITFGSPGWSAADFPPVAAASFSNLVGPRRRVCRLRGGDGVGGS